MGKLQWRLRCYRDHWILIYNLKQLLIQTRSQLCYKYTFCRVNDSFQHIVWQSEHFTFTLCKPVIGSAANCSVFKSDVAVQHSPKRVGSASPYNLCLFFFKSPLHTASCYLLLAAINLPPDSGTSKSGAVVTSLSPPSPLAWTKRTLKSSSEVILNTLSPPPASSLVFCVKFVALSSVEN